MYLMWLALHYQSNMNICTFSHIVKKISHSHLSFHNYSIPCSNLQWRRASDLVDYLCNYVGNDPSYTQESRNCQTFATDLCGFLTGNHRIEPFKMVRFLKEVKLISGLRVSPDACFCCNLFLSSLSSFTFVFCNLHHYD